MANEQKSKDLMGEEVREIEKDFRQLDSIEKATLERIGGTLSKGQRSILRYLELLLRSLAGPEEVVDDTYKRNFPSENPKYISLSQPSVSAPSR